MVLNEAQEVKGIVGFVVPTFIPSSVNVNPFNYWIEKLEKNYDSKCLLWLWWTLGLYAIFLVCFFTVSQQRWIGWVLFKNFFKKKNKTKKGKHACELGLIRTDFRHGAGQSIHIMLPVFVQSLLSGDSSVPRVFSTTKPLLVSLPTIQQLVLLGPFSAIPILIQRKKNTEIVCYPTTLTRNFGDLNFPNKLPHILVDISLSIWILASIL